MRTPTFLLPLALFLSAVAAQAVVPQDATPARSLALGRSRAFAQGLDALVLNPAGLGAVHRFEADVDYFHVTATDSARGGDGVSGWVADSASNSQLAGALAYRYIASGAGAGTVRGGIADFGLSYQVIPQLLFGGRLSYLSYQTGGRDVHHLTADAGAMGLVGPVMLGLTGFNLVTVDAPEAARGLSFAAGLSDDRFYRVGADVRWEWLAQGPVASATAGGELLLQEAVPVRAGVEWDRVRERVFLTFGLGWVTSSWGLDLAARRDTDSGETILGVALKLFDT